MITARSLVAGDGPLRAALDTWGDISFEYESTDMPDVVATPVR